METPKKEIENMTSKVVQIGIRQSKSKITVHLNQSETFFVSRHKNQQPAAAEPC